MNNKIIIKSFTLVMMIGVAALSRLLPHPPNFTPIGAIALFGAAYFSRRWLAILVPFLALWLSDILLSNVVYAQYYEQFQWFNSMYIYLGFGLIALLGFFSLRKISLTRLLGTSLGASLIFFLVTNFGVWASGIGSTYPKTFSGLLACYAAGIPYFWNTLAGDLFYVAVLFGAYEWVIKPRLTAQFSYEKK